MTDLIAYLSLLPPRPVGTLMDIDPIEKWNNMHIGNLAIFIPIHGVSVLTYEQLVQKLLTSKVDMSFLSEDELARWVTAAQNARDYMLETGDLVPPTEYILTPSTDPILIDPLLIEIG